MMKGFGDMELKDRKTDLYTPIRNAFFWALILGASGAMLGGFGIGLLINGHVGWSTLFVILCAAALMWADRFYQKGANLLWESLGGSFLSEKYPVGRD